MPPTAARHRPQTLKQAKKAYRKSGATVRLSESERAVIERQAVLQERADRIKAREARRKTNVKRKDERNQRERDARQRMGIAEPVKEGIHVGPSQLHLGAFMAIGAKRKREDEPAELTRAEKEFFASVDSKQCHALSISKTPWRNPLQPIAANTMPLQRQPTYAGKTEEIEMQESESSSKRPPLSCSAPQPIPAEGSPHPNSPPVIETVETSKEEGSVPPRFQPAPMGPPPSRRPLQTELTEHDAKQNPSAIAPQDKPPDTMEDCWDDFFVSSTQIARELSPPTRLPIMPPITKPSPQPLIPLPIAPEDDTPDLLDQISSQDLDFTGQLPQAAPLIVTEDTDFLLAQISTQDLDFSSDLTQPAPKAPKIDSSDFDEDLTEEDLEDVALEFELESLAKSRTATLSPQRPKTECGYGEQNKSCYAGAPIKHKHKHKGGFDPFEAYFNGDPDNPRKFIYDCRIDPADHRRAPWSDSDEYASEGEDDKPSVTKTKPSTIDMNSTALDNKPHLLDNKLPLQQPPYQDTKPAAEFDVFDLDLSTQDLRDLEC